MAVQAQCYGGVPPAYDYEVEAQTQQEYYYYGYRYKYNCAAAVASGAQSGLTCNDASGRKRGREVADRHVPSSSALLLPIPGMEKAIVPSPAVDDEFGAASCRMVESAMTSTSGRTSAASATFDGAVVSELHRQGAEMDALVRAGCERVHAGLEQARKRQCASLVRAASAAAARALQEKEVQLEAARRRAAALEERLQQVAAESQAWCGLARSNGAVAAGLRATLDHVLLLRAAPTPAPAEGSGESDDFASPAPLAAADDAQSCCFVAKDAPSTEDAASSPAGKWACKACGEREATVLLLPCRHLCLCKACEPRLDACPVCLAAKNTCVVACSPTEVSQM